MKIAMIGQKGIPSRAGGIEIHVEQLSSRLVKLGCDVQVYCRKGYCDSDNDIYKGIQIKYSPYIKSKHLDAITHTFTSTIKALFSGCDIFHYHALGPSTLAFIPRLFGKKVVCTVHGLDWQRGKWGSFASKFLKFGEYATARFSHKTINVSNTLIDYYKKKYNKDTVYIPNGIEEAEIVPPEINKSKYNLGKDEYILFLARLVPEKGAHFLIEAYKSISIGKKLVIAGGASHSEKYEKELHKLAQGNDNIIFTGFVAGKELNELYSNAYLYILPSEIEGLPISLLEAMSHGNCCLTSDIPENVAVIENMGYVFKKSQVSDLANQIVKLVNDESLVKKIRQNVTDYVTMKYNWDVAAEMTYNVYKNLFRNFLGQSL